MAVALAAGLALVLEFRNSPGWISQTDVVDSLVLAPEWQWRLCLSGITAAAIALGMGYLTRWVGPRRGLVAIPRLWRVGTNPVPTLGGIGIVAGALAGVAASQWSEGKSAKVLGAAVGVTAMCVIGSVDDVGGLSSRTRLFVTIVVAELAWLLGLRAQVFDDGFLGDAANAVVTILWFIVVTHAFNTFDNFDGASGGVGAIAALSFAAIALQRDQIYVAGLAVAVAGACAGFLVHNRFPARLFMGDSGALAIGFALASIGLMLRPKASPPLTFAVPALVVGLPLFDAAVVISARLHASIPVAIGGTDHLAHRLSRSGLRPLAVAALLWCAQLGLAAAAFVVARASRGVGWTAGAAAAGVLVLSLWLVQRLPGWEPGSG